MTTEQIAAGKLTKAQRELLGMPESLGRMMGGWFGLRFDQPEMLEAVGINHPIFGSHYRLTPLGLAVRDYLEKEARL